jgi:predicted nucleic-acid-binding protein
VLSRGYRFARADIAETVRRLIAGATVVVDRPAAEAGLRLLEAGGDFADGVIAHLGALSGAEVFLSFDKAAVSRLQAQGVPARLLR